jgi:hypothetical protein
MTTQDPRHNPHEEEARQRWGHTDAWKQSQERVRKMSKEQLAAIGAEAEALTQELAAAAEAGKAPQDEEVQALVARHYAGLRHFYEPNPAMYRGLADMYVADARFAANYDKVRPGLAVFLRDAMHAYCTAQEA